jgi:anaerobic magnesium-protoporphyrin IX monomethyl ester cyclase
MKVALLGAELEENLGLRYMASALAQNGHLVEIIPFNTESDIAQAVQQVVDFEPQLAGLSMVFTGRGREFCKLAQAMRTGGYRGHIVAGGHFAALNCERLLQDFPAFDSVALGEGEELICNLANSLDDLTHISGICYRAKDGAIRKNPSTGNPDKLDELPFPRRDSFHAYFNLPIASILSSRGCWRDCAFCSINAWYKQGGGKKFRVRSVENIVAEMKELYFKHGIRIFNFQDDNFFLPNPEKATQRFIGIRDGLREAGVGQIGIAVKARPDSIHEAPVKVLDELGLFRVFLGVENASERGLRNLNRICSVDQILNALRILNQYDVHIAYNLLMFEPDTVMDDILINLRFMEKHIENPFNFCRAEAYAGTGLEKKLLAENRLLGDYFGFDYRLKDPCSEAFHQIANYAFFDRNFSDFGLHYFNMQVDFFFQLLRRFHPALLTQTLRAAVRNFIKQTNLDTYECLCQIYDFVAGVNPDEHFAIRHFAQAMRKQVDERSRELYARGKTILGRLDEIYETRGKSSSTFPGLQPGSSAELPFLASRPVPYTGIDQLKDIDFLKDTAGENVNDLDFFGIAPAPVPYTVFKKRRAEQDERQN